jgi:hypothetical protein
MRFLLVALLFGVAPMLRAQSVAPGTYRVWLCVAVCAPEDSLRSVADAFVVVFDDSTAQSQTVSPALAALRSIRTARGGPLNACFRVTRRQSAIGKEELFFGITPSAATRVRTTDGGGFVLPMYASPDAFYDLRWSGTGAITAGEGWASGPFAEDPYHRNAMFSARRIGEPDVSRCSA